MKSMWSRRPWGREIDSTDLLVYQSQVMFSLSSWWLPTITPTLMLLVQKQLLCISLWCVLCCLDLGKGLKTWEVLVQLRETLLEGRDELEITPRQWLRVVITQTVHLPHFVSVLLVRWLILVGRVREAKKSPSSAQFQSQCKTWNFLHVLCSSHLLHRQCIHFILVPRTC